jgi:hypothetical protein
MTNPRRSSSFAITHLFRIAINPNIYLVRLQSIIVASRWLKVRPFVFSPKAVMDGTMLLEAGEAGG